jgi:di/tricarboxylate transporter
MNYEAWLMAGVLVAMFALLIWGNLPTWLVFLSTLTITMTLSLAPVDELLSGFSNPGVITVAALFLIAAGMYATGAITIASNLLVGLPEKLPKLSSRYLHPSRVPARF